MKEYPGTLTQYNLFHSKLPESEYDPSGVPYGIQPDYERPYLDSLGNIRSVMVYRPSTLLPMIHVRSLYIISEENETSGIEFILTESGLADLAEKERAYLVFLLPSKFGWNSLKNPEGPDDVDIVHHVLDAGQQWYLFPGREKCHSYLLGLVGIGKGAEMAQVAAAEHPEHISSLLTFGGIVTENMLSKGRPDAEMFVWSVNTEGDGYRFWYRVNGLENSREIINGNTIIRVDPENRAKQVRLTKSSYRVFDGGVLYRFWYEAFSGNMRPHGIGSGKVHNYNEAIEKYNPCIHINDRVLGDNGGYPHSWYEFIPKSVQEQRFEPGFSCPLIIVLHGGGSDHNISVSEFKLHELGEREGFITVYAKATYENSWNSVLSPMRKNDLEYITALIEYMKRNYPVDPSRVYMSGFSNGSGMAQLTGAARPDLVAGILAYNTRFKCEEYMWDLARKAKQQYDYRMPVFSTYGTLDAEYPPQEGCGQFTQMRFWKWFNNIEQKELRSDDPSGVGVPGDQVVSWGKYGPNGEPIFTTHQYITRDASKINYYNYTLIKGLPHSVEQRVTEAGWRFISQFSRMPDGSLRMQKKEEAFI